MQNYNGYSTVRAFIFSLLFASISLILEGQTKGGQPIIETQSAGSGETFGLVIGISDYQDEGIPDLEYADRDAEAFAGFLQSRAGGSLDKDHLKVLINEEATAGNFAAALEWLVEMTDEGDRVILYFSGHGDVEPTTINQLGFLLCWDAPSRVYVAGGTLGLIYLQAYISTLSTQNKASVTVIADACRAGELSGNSVNGSQVTSANLFQKFDNEIKILSCQPTEYSIEGDQWGGGRGVFSYHLVNGLYGMADRDRDGTITVMELRSYLEEKVASEVAPFNQLPIAWGDGRKVLAQVDNEILKDIELSKKGAVQMYSAIALRGIEDKVLESVDASTRSDYEAFELALEEGRFLSPKHDCADLYFNRLMADPDMSELHSAITRNYAAALQDDAQQALNLDLTTGLDRQITESVRLRELYKDYPALLDRAIDLLGKDHYMYPDLMARKYYFNSRLVSGDSLRKIELRKALHYQPNMPHSYRRMMWQFKPEQEDSVLFYANKTMELAPNWVKPYVSLFFYYKDEKQDENKALHWLYQGKEIDPNSSYVLYILAQYYRNVEKLDSAEYYYQKTIENTNSNICFPCAHNQYGVLLISLGKFEEAEEHFLYALYDPRSLLNPSLVMTNLAIANNNLKKYDKAFDYVNMALEKDSSIYKTYWVKGLIYEDIDSIHLAEKYYLKALAVDSSDKGIFNDLGEFYEDQNEHKKAAFWYKKSLRHFPNSHGVLGNIGYNLIESGNSEAAIPYYERALKIAPYQTDYLSSLGSIYLSTQRNAKAYPLLKRLFMVDSTDADSYLYLAAVTSNMGDHKEAYRLIKKGLTMDSSDVMSITNAGVITKHLRKYDESEKYLLKAIGMDSFFLSAWNVLSGVYLDMGMHEKSIILIDQMIKFGASPVWVKNTTANIFISVGRYQEAELELKDLLIQYPNTPWIYNQLGLIYEMQDLPEKALEYYQLAITYNPRNLNFYRNLALQYRNQGKYDLALETCKQYMQEIPEDPAIYNMTGDLLYVMGEYEEAEKYLSYGLMADSTHWILYLTLGQVKQAQRQWQESLEPLLKGLEVNPVTSYFPLFLSIAYYHLGNSAEAERYIQLAEESGIDGFEARFFYAQYLAASDQISDAWKQLEIAFKEGAGKDFIYLIGNREPDFETMRSDPRWSQLMNKYFIELASR